MKSGHAKRIDPSKRKPKKSKEDKARDRFLLKIMGIFFAIVFIFWILSSLFSFVHTKITAKDENKEIAVQEVAPKKIQSKPAVKEIKPLPADDPSLPKSYDYYYKLVNRKVSIESDEVGGSVVKEVSLLDALPPIEFVSASQSESATNTNPPNEETSTDRITFQIAAFMKKQEAEQFMSLLRKKALKAHVTESNNQELGKVYQVKVGPYDQEQATQVRKALSDLKLKPIEFKN